MEWLKKLIMGLVVFVSVTFVHAGYFPPKDIQKLIEKTEILNDQCRGGSGDDPLTMKACDQREQLVKKIEKKGYCFGALNKNDATYRYSWLPCKLDATRK